MLHNAIPSWQLLGSSDTARRAPQPTAPPRHAPIHALNSASESGEPLRSPAASNGQQQGCTDADDFASRPSWTSKFNN